MKDAKMLLGLIERDRRLCWRGCADRNEHGLFLARALIVVVARTLAGAALDLVFGSGFLLRRRLAGTAARNGRGGSRGHHASAQLGHLSLEVGQPVFRRAVRLLLTPLRVLLRLRLTVGLGALPLLELCVGSFGDRVRPFEAIEMLLFGQFLGIEELARAASVGRLQG
jgi:hypothetical protein